MSVLEKIKEVRIVAHNGGFVVQAKTVKWKVVPVWQTVNQYGDLREGKFSFHFDSQRDASVTAHKLCRKVEQALESLRSRQPDGTIVETFDIVTFEKNPEHFA